MLSDDEIIYRSALYPRMVKSGVVAPEKAVSDFFREADANGNTIYTISVGRGTLFRSLDHVHDYGCRVAANTNEERAKEKGSPLERPGQTVHYLGSFKLAVSDVLAAPRRLVDLSVVHHPLPGLDEHCNIVMQRNAIEARKSEVSAERTSILVHLRLSLYDPEPHICACDVDLISTFGDVRLTLAPAGESGEIPLTSDRRKD
ncbi:hypothetical protein [Mesorhizobium sp. BR-1-1-10]|uniref:hypothetical protein n=1 Tax=Mesorhizobium sp. BR-1-1-10 TaxID=2876660 RepID=UPI001CD080CD|nr:hypothetical protein [Mesorhizobium sp. BR-1-1-10]MBZ9979194.1 hypothetical protein [Mesorhizobium sp. BR-1-1-10]